jgi:sorbitol/mannitol transport system permease protein
MGYIQQQKIKKNLLVVLAWIVAILMFFPIFWMILTSFKTELQAIAVPPLFFFEPTFENFSLVQERSDYLKFATNSVITSVGATFFALLIAIPAAYSMAFFPSKYTKDMLLWMLSTKMLPAVGVLMPIYFIAQKFNLLDTKFMLIVIFMMMNLPIIVWMLYSYFKEIPKEILEAGRIDGSNYFTEIYHLVLPLSWGGIASTALLSIILCWNEAFWSIILTSTESSTLTAMIASYSSPEGLFWAKLSAASVLACGPIVIFGWLTQKQLVTGLTFGAVK